MFQKLIELEYFLNRDCNCYFLKKFYGNVHMKVNVEDVVFFTSWCCNRAVSMVPSGELYIWLIVE